MSQILCNIFIIVTGLYTHHYEELMDFIEKDVEQQERIKERVEQYSSVDLRASKHRDDVLLQQQNECMYHSSQFYFFSFLITDSSKNLFCL